MEAQEFWRQYEVADKEHKKWEKRADKVLKRYRLDEQEKDPSFNILWANTAVMMPSYFSQVPTPDIRRRYRDDDPVAKQGAKLLERSLEFVMDDGDFYTFGERTVFDYLLPGRSVAKVRYCPYISKSVKTSELWSLAPEGENEEKRWFTDDGDEVSYEQIRFQDDTAFYDQEVEEVLDEHVVIERWPWKNFRHQKAKRWEDVGWIDYISYLDKAQLKKMFGRKADQIELTVDASGEDGKRDTGFKPTHAEIHEVWFINSREVKIGAKGLQDKWLQEKGDPLRLDGFWPCPRPLYAVDTNDSLMPIPLFTLYQHQANELDLITKRISVLMRALKVAGLYAGSEKETLKKLFEADENQMIPVADWSVIQAGGGVNRLIDWLPIEQVGKVLTALFQEREQIISQIFELTGIADIQRGSTDPRETKGAQVIKAQFANQRNISPRQEVERYFRDTLRIAAEIMAEHFDPQTLERMTGLQVPPEVYELLHDQLSRQYRIDIETQSTIAPDEEREQANMASALEAVTGYVSSLAPLAQQGLIPPEAAVRLLKVYLRKFRWGREIEETLEEIERNPPQPKPDPEQEKMKAEMEMKQAEMQADMQMEQQKLQAEMQKKQAELQFKLQEMQMKLQQMQAEMQLDREKAQMEMAQDQQRHMQELQQDQMVHAQEMDQSEQRSQAEVESIRAKKMETGSDSRGSETRSSR